MASAQLKTRRPRIPVRTSLKFREEDDSYSVAIPTSAASLAGFREWCWSDAFPQRGKIAFLGGEINVDMSRERINSHVSVKTEVFVVVGNLDCAEDSGSYYLSGVRFVHVGAAISNEPDAMFVRWDSFETGRVRGVPTKEGDDWIELEGTPDWILEVVSPSSVMMDTVKLLDRYHRAGVPEYWIIDARDEKIVFNILLHHPDGYCRAPVRAGWQRCGVFARHFRVIRRADRLGELEFRLEMK